jgi:toxin ParE1/3/4
LRIEWTGTAKRHLSQLDAYLYERSPDGADRVVDRIYEMVSSLSRFPRIGRPGRVAGTREMVVPYTNYVVAYRLLDEVVQILAVMHGAQRWPRNFDRQ